MPFLFDEFRPADTAAAAEVQLEEQASKLQMGAGPSISATDALRDLMDIVKGMLGSQVCAESKPLHKLMFDDRLLICCRMPSYHCY